jgi:hypothetical protein
MTTNETEAPSSDKSPQATSVAEPANTPIPAPWDIAPPEKPKKSWAILNQELKNALNTWEVLSEEVGTKISPEEQQLQEVKRLLTELKDKLKQFSE